MFRFKAHTAKPLNEAKIRLALLNRMRKVGRLMRKDLEATVATWSGDKPKFDFNVSLRGGPTLTFFLAPSGAGKEKWERLNEGYDDRRAVMTPDFEPKTEARWLGSKPGRGEVAYIDLRTTRTVEARQWTVALAEKWKGPFASEMQEAMDEGARATGHTRRR